MNEMNPEILRYLSNPEMRKMIREAMGPIRIYERFAYPSGYEDTYGMLHAESRWELPPDFIRLPAFCDFDENGKPTKRCLVGMALKEAESFTISITDKYSYVKILHLSGDLIRTVQADNPYLALLRALAAQWGIEV